MIKFKINNWVTDKDIEEMNISSLLFDSDWEICTLYVGNIGLSLSINGKIRILDENTGNIYKNYSQYPTELTNLIKEGKDIEQYGYNIDMSNWFELFIDIIDENGNGIEEVLCEISDIEGQLDNNNLRESLLKYMIREFNSYIELKDIDVMTISDNERLLLADYNIVNIFSSYEELSLNTTGKLDEEEGREIFMNNSRYVWVEVLDNNTRKEFILESEER